MPISLTALWSGAAFGPVRAVRLAREADLLLVRDGGASLTLWNHAGALQGQTKIPQLAAADIAEDGVGIVAACTSGRLIWLALDLQPRWELQIRERIVAVAVDSFGQYLAVADAKGVLHLFDRLQRELGQFHSPRPVQHLAFAPAAPYLACAGDFGWAGLLDLFRGDWHWSDRPVVNISQLAVAAGGDPLALACFSEGIRLYGAGGSARTSIQLPRPCGVVALTFDGRRGVAAGMAREVFAFARTGEHVATLPTPHTPIMLALSARADRLYCGYGDGGIQTFRMSWE